MRVKPEKDQAAQASTVHGLSTVPADSLSLGGIADNDRQERRSNESLPQASPLVVGIVVLLCAGCSAWAFLTTGDLTRYLMALSSSKLVNPPPARSLVSILVLVGLLGLCFAVVSYRTWRLTSSQQEIVSHWSPGFVLLWALLFWFLLLVNYPIPFQAHHRDKFLLVGVTGLVWALWFVLRPLSLDRWLSSRLYGWLKIGLVNLLVFATVGEVAMRLADPLLARSGLFGDKQTPANLRSHLAVRGSIGFTNSQGFRDRERLVERATPAPRALALGDSFTWGAGVSYDEAFPTLLERGLQTSYQGVEVINLGVPAWGPHEELHLLQVYGIRYHPDLVVLNFFVGNDIQNKRGDDTNLPEILVVAGRSYYVHSNGNWVHDTLGLDRWYLYHNLNYLVRVGVSRMRRAGESRQGVMAGEWVPLVSRGQYLRGIHESSDIYLTVNSPYFDHHWNRTKNTLLAMRDFLRANRIPLLIVLIPAPVQLDHALQAEYLASVRASADLYDFQKPQRLLRAWCQENEVPCIDLLPVFEAAGSPAALYLQNDIHWTSAGHQLAAASIFPFLKPNLVRHTDDTMEADLERAK